MRLESTAEIIVDRDVAKKFGAFYEKDCQSRHEPDVCRRTAARSHVTCFKSSVRQREGMGVDYDRDAYVECIRKTEKDALNEALKSGQM